MPWQASCRHNSIPMPVLPSCAPASPIHTSAYMIWSGTQTKTGDESACGGFPGLCRRLSEESYFELSARVPAVFRQHYARPVSSSSEAHCAAPWKKVSCRRLSRRSPSRIFWQKVAEERIHSYKKWQCEFILRALPVANGRDGDSQWILFARIELWSCLSIQDSGSKTWSLVVEFESP
jgi:hypothetical protein